MTLPISEPDNEAAFRRFIMATAQYSATQVQQSSAILATAVRDQALHILTYTVKLDQAWSLTRDILLAMAPKMEQMGHRDDWLPYLEQGVAQSQQVGDQATEAELRLHIGHLYRLRSKFDYAREWLLQSIDQFALLGQTQGQARALNQLAYLAWQQHHYVEAEQLATMALTLLAEADPERASSYNTLGEIAKTQRHWPDAERFHQTALVIWKTQDNKRRMAWSLQNLGATFVGQQKYKEAIDCYQEAIVVLEQTQDFANLGIVQMNLGVAYSFTKQPSAAISCFASAESLFNKTQDLHNLAKVLTSKGIDLLALRQWQQAENAFTASITLFQELGDLLWCLNAKDGLGLAYLEQHLYHQAIPIFEMAIVQSVHLVETSTSRSIVQSLLDHLDQANKCRVSN